MASAASAPGNSSLPDRRRGEIYAQQVRLLYANAPAGAAVTAGVAGILAYLEWGAIAHGRAVIWLCYMLAVALARFALERWYRAARPAAESVRYWSAAFLAGTVLAAGGWVAAAFLLYPEGDLMGQVVLAFVLGGMMLGAGSILAARPEAFFVFAIPTGLTIAARFFLEGTGPHRAMGALAVIFTAATLLTTRNVYYTILASLELRFANRDLVAGLREANERVERLNQELEQRVRQRTAELKEANEQLRAEMDQRQRMEEELVRARKMEALGVLAGGIAHDFNNFLTIVQGNLGLAKLDLEEDHPAAEVVERTLAACRRAASLANQLMTFGRGGAPVRRVAALGPLVRDAVELARAGANVGWKVETAEELWAAEVDTAQVSHALQNILINARQAMPQGGVVEVRSENVEVEEGALPVSAGKYVRISVRDQGGGIAAEHLPHIFEPYFTTKPAGTGLGLAAAYSIAHKHDGHITVETAAGSGSTFAMYLPAATEPAMAAPAAEETIESGSGRILIMDDEEMLRMVLSRILRRLGYTVVSASDGAEAIAICQEDQRFDAAVLDLTVPGGMGGVEAAARLREIDPRLALIASSGYSADAVMSEYGEYGFDEAIPKPWTAAQVSEVLKRVLERRGGAE